MGSMPESQGSPSSEWSSGRLADGCRTPESAQPGVRSHETSALSPRTRGPRCSNYSCSTGAISTGCFTRARNARNKTRSACRAQFTRMPSACTRDSAEQRASRHNFAGRSPMSASTHTRRQAQRHRIHLDYARSEALSAALRGTRSPAKPGPHRSPRASALAKSEGCVS
jgi:hypothetical protein